MNYVFTNKPEFEEPIRVLFLCGTKYTKNDSDKRTILKKYLERAPENKAIILEEYYNFKQNRNSPLLSYYETELFSLFNIEMLAAAFSTNVIIIHESNSTAGEIAAFAGNPYIRDKLIVLAPERYSIEEEKISNFLSLAFWNKKNKKIKNDIIRFYPFIKKYNVSPNRSSYYTYFKNNELPSYLSRKLDTIIGHSFQKENVKIDLGKKLEKNNEVVYLDFFSFKNYVFSLYTIKEFRDELHNCKKIYEIKNLFIKRFKEILKNTYIFDLGSCKKIKIILNHQIDLNFEDAISMMIYIMNACDIFHISKCENSDNIKVQKAKGSVERTQAYAKLLKKQNLKEWGE